MHLLQVHLFRHLGHQPCSKRARTWALAHWGRLLYRLMHLRALSRLGGGEWLGWQAWFCVAREGAEDKSVMQGDAAGGPAAGCPR